LLLFLGIDKNGNEEFRLYIILFSKKKHTTAIDLPSVVYNVKFGLLETFCKNCVAKT
jgi:hypothetical protein